MHDSSSEKLSWTEKADSNDSDQEPPEDVPDYDDLIESTLDSLDVYQAHRADMNRHLKTVCCDGLHRLNLTYSES
jgi:hypothetical protein